VLAVDGSFLSFFASFLKSRLKVFLSSLDMLLSFSIASSFAIVGLEGVAFFSPLTAVSIPSELYRSLFACGGTSTSVAETVLSATTGAAFLFTLLYS
jgi:hypothetical protein